MLTTKKLFKTTMLTACISAFAATVVANEVITYTSNNTVATYSPIFPEFADPSWPTTVCRPDASIGLEANWIENGNAYQFGTNVHPWQPQVQLQAQWINAWSDLSSRGPGGHSWTRYSLDVEGVGSFDLTLLADNCSWVYLDGNLVGFQGADWNANNMVYPVTMSGTHKLDFVIYDGGGLAGGMFKLETNTGRTYSDDDNDELTNQEEILIGTSPTNPDTDADGVSDGDEVAAGSDPLDANSFPVVDSDNDGVEDAADFCADTTESALVDVNGCSGPQLIAQSCNCSGPTENQLWKSHGQYVSCVARTKNRLVKDGLLTEDEGAALVETAAKSACGKK